MRFIGIPVRVCVALPLLLLSILFSPLNAEWRNDVRDWVWGTGPFPRY